MQRISGDSVCAVEPTGLYRVVRTFRGHMMKAGPPAVHFRRAAERYRDAWLLRTEGHSVSCEHLFRDAWGDTVRWILAVTGLAPLYRRWYQWRRPKFEYRDLDEVTRRAVELFMAELQAANMPGLSRVLLYGSHARGDHDRWSDIDIAVVLSGSKPGDKARSELNERLVMDFHLTRDWNTTQHVAEFRRVTESMKKLAGEVDVVITHFPPTLEALDRALYEGQLTNPYFINDCEWLVRQVGAKLWVSGHTHSPFDYRVGDTRVIGNPRGFREEQAQPGFCPTRMVEV